MRVKASVTIYSALMLIAVLTLVFALLETSRVSAARKKSTIYTDLSCESLAAEFQDEAYSDWKVLMLDGGIDGKLDQGELNTRLKRYCTLSEDVTHSKSLVQISCDNAEVTKYELVTDNDGDVMYELVRDATKDMLTQSAIDELTGRYGGMEEGGKLGELRNRINQAKHYIAQAEAKEAEEERKRREEGLESTTDASSDNQVKEKREAVKNLLSLFSDSYLTLLVSDWDGISNLSIDPSERLLNRHVQRGNYGEVSKQEVYDKIVLAYFDNQNFKSLMDRNESSEQLAYELEYIVAGKSSDKANLENVLTYILLQREAVNFGYLLTDEAKLAEATTLAASVTGILGIPAAVEAVKYGILCAWAFCESVLEVRALTEGKKIYILKDSNSWNLSLSSILSSGVRAGGIKEAENGFSYEDFLYLRFLLGNRKELIYRTMDVMEFNLQKKGLENARMDNMLSKYDVEEKWDMNNMFLNLAPIRISSISIYEFTETEGFSYY